MVGNLPDLQPYLQPNLIPQNDSDVDTSRRDFLAKYNVSDDFVGEGIKRAFEQARALLESDDPDTIQKGAKLMAMLAEKFYFIPQNKKSSGPQYIQVNQYQRPAFLSSSSEK
jgi:hypothetical protein